MELRANIRTDSTGNITVFMKGRLDYEDTHHLQTQLEGLARANPTSRITIDFGQVSFVGSSGIGPFWDLIKTLNQRKDQIRLASVPNEFLKVFQLYSQRATGEGVERLIIDMDEDYADGPSKANPQGQKNRPLGRGL